MPVPFGTDVRVQFGEPIARRPDEDPTEVLERCRAFAQDTLDEWHRSSANST
jgi:hypothetical protein